MKKLLALVLALVMTLGLATVSSSAAFSDADSIQYDEAVDVMSTIGVLAGMEDGKFNPTGILTREQAAKIVTYMILGKSAADALVTIAAPYSDVAADRWSAGAIAYCSNEGILAGTGNGKFDPAGQLTGLAFAKMCLTALGYKADLEGLVGDSWSINTAKLALTTGLTDDLDDVVLSNPMTREQAAQMALNVLTAGMVHYPNNSTITAGDVTIRTNSDATKTGKTFMKEYWSKLERKGNETDDFKTPAHVWTYKNAEIGTYADSAEATFTGTVKYGQLYTAIGSTALKNLNDVDVYVDGLRVAAQGTNRAENKAFDADNITKGSDTKIGYDATWKDGDITDDTYPTGNGASTSVYVKERDDDKYDVSIVIVNTYVGKVTKVTAATEKADRYVSIANKGVAITLKDSGKFETEELAKDDYVLFTAAWVENTTYAVKSASVVTPVTNQTVSAISGSKFTAEGTTYKFNKNAADETKAVTLGDSYDLYLDSNGLVVYRELYNSALDASNYLVVIADDASTSLGTTTIKANAVTLDGLFLGDITLGKLDSKKINAESKDKTGTKVTLYTVYSFTKDGDKYNLKPVAAPYRQTTYDMNGGDDAYATGATSYNGTTVNSATKFVVYNNDKDTVKVYDGIKNMVNVADDAMNGACSLIKDSKGVVVFMEVSATTSNSSSAKDLVYILDTTPRQTKDGNDVVYTYDAIVDGAVTTISTKDIPDNDNNTTTVAERIAAAGNGVGLYYVTSYDGKYIERSGFAVADTTGSGTNAPTDMKGWKLTPNTDKTFSVSYDDDVLTITQSGDQATVKKTTLVDSKTTFWRIDDDGNAETTTAENLVEDAVSYTYWVVEKTTDKVDTATMIFVQE